MKNKKNLIAQYLYNIAKESKSEVIEVSKGSELAKIAEKMNIVIPSPDIAILKTVYAKMNEANRNNVVLPKKAAEKALPSIIGKQANWSHKGKNYVCGWILDAKIENDFVVTYVAIYKSLFPEEYEKMKEMVKDNTMAVSFEIWSIDSETKNSVMHDLGNGTYSIDPIIYHGIGILIEGETPACPEAYADKMLAKADTRLIEEAERIACNINDGNLIFASMALDNNIKVDEKILKKEDDKVDKEKDIVETSEETKPEETSEETKTDDNSEKAEEKKADADSEKSDVDETKSEDIPKGTETQKSEEIVPKIVIKVINEYSEVCIDTYVDGTPSGTSDRKCYSKSITEYSDGTKDEVVKELDSKKKYDFAELEKAVNDAKAEKDVEIANLKAEHVKELKEQNEKIETQTKELDLKDQEIAKLQPEKEEEIKTSSDETPEMEVGAVEKAKEDTETERRQNEINDIIAKKHKNE